MSRSQRTAEAKLSRKHASSDDPGKAPSVVARIGRMSTSYAQ